MTDIEGEMARYLQDMSIGQGTALAGSERLYHRLDTLAGQMSQGDALIGDALKKLSMIDSAQSEANLERQDDASNLEGGKEVMQQAIEEAIGGFVRSLQVIEIEGRELAAKGREVKRKVEVAAEGKR
jgi:hypothetical protein